MTSTGRQTLCRAACQNGQPCRAWAVTKAGFCNSHDPTRAGVMADARRRGGRARHGRRVGPTGERAPVKLATLADVLDLLARTADDLLALENSVARGRALVSLAAAWADCYESSELEKRVSALEANHAEATAAHH